MCSLPLCLLVQLRAFHGPCKSIFIRTSRECYKPPGPLSAVASHSGSISRQLGEISDYCCHDCRFMGGFRCPSLLPHQEFLHPLPIPWDTSVHYCRISISDREGTWDKCDLHLATFGDRRNVSAGNLCLRLALDSVGCDLPQALLYAGGGEPRFWFGSTTSLVLLLLVTFRNCQTSTLPRRCS